MSRMKLGLAALLAVVAVSGVATASASAGQWYVNGAKFTGTETVSAEGKGALVLKTTVGTSKTPLELSCAKGKGTGSIFSSSKDESSGFSFEECKVVTPSGCKTEATLKTKALSSELNAAGTEDNYTPKSGTEFIKIPIEGCSIEGSYAVTGNASCKTAASEAVSESCVFTAGTEEALKFGVNEATFGGEFVFALSGTNKGKVWGSKSA